MKTPPLVSILIPTYNRANLLGRALQSIIDQTFRDFEIIVVDDGSTDETRALVEDSLQGVSFRYIFQDKKGVAGARATGLKLCQGQYIAFCDSDDIWLPEKLERQMPLFAPETGLVFSDAYAFTEMSVKPKAKFRFYELTMPFLGEVYTHIARKNFIITSSVIVRRALLEDFEQYPITNFDDWQMWLWVARKKKLFDYVDLPLIYYYEHCSVHEQHWNA